MDQVLPLDNAKHLVDVCPDDVDGEVSHSRNLHSGGDVVAEGSHGVDDCKGAGETVTQEPELHLVIVNFNLIRGATRRLRGLLFVLFAFPFISVQTGGPRPLTLVHQVVFDVPI